MYYFPTRMAAPSPPSPPEKAERMTRPASKFPQGKIYDTFSNMIEKETAKKIQDLVERMHLNMSAMQEFTCTYPDIPFIHEEEGQDVRVRTFETPLGGNYSLMDEGIDSFFVHDFSPGGNKVLELVPQEDRLMVVRTYPYEEDQVFYLGKYVTEAPPGGEYAEDDTTITMAPQKEGEEVDYYCLNLLRDAGRIVVSKLDFYEPSLYNESQSITSFGGIPWLIKTRTIGDYTDAIFRNLHDNKTRRYILRGFDSDFLMLQGEFYFLRRCGKKDFTVVQCRSGKEALYSDDDEAFVLEGSFYWVTSCLDYVVFLDGRNDVLTVMYALDAEPVELPPVD